MKLIEIIDKKQFDSFIGAQNHSQFFQSYEWGEFQESAGFKVIRFGIEDGDKIIFAFSLIKKKLFLGLNYFYAPRIGIKYLSKEQLNFLFNEIAKIARKENVIFLRFEPRSEFRISDFHPQGTSGFLILKTIDVQPSRTLILNLKKTEDELLKDMHQKTRYNIRLADRKGVVVHESYKEEDFEKFWNIMDETRTRDRFRLYGKNYYKKMLEVNGDFKIKLFIAEYKGEIIAGNIIAFFGNMATYVHGASSNKYRNVMAPYALQWQVIKKAKDLDYSSYDFHGIDETKWPGVTRFKKGFGGEEAAYPGTYDIIFNKAKYTLYNLLRKIRRRF